jgi:hypothetical protein
MGFFLVLKAELVRSFIIMRRYWFATLTGLLVGYGFLILLILAFLYNQDAVVAHAEAMAQKAASGVLGFVIGMFGFGIVGMFSQGLQGMARTGELEQVCMSPHGLITNFMARSFVSAVTSILSSAIILFLVARTIQGKLHADFGPTLTLLALTYLNLLGFGFMVGGLVLVFKQTGQIAILLRLALLGLAVVAGPGMSEWPWPARAAAHVLPITDASVCLKHTLIEGQQTPVKDDAGRKVVKEYVPVLDANGEPIVDEEGMPQTAPVYETKFQSVYKMQSFYFLIINSIVWTLLGITCFHYLEDWSRDKGTLGAY